MFGAIAFGDAEEYRDAVCRGVNALVAISSGPSEKEIIEVAVQHVRSLPYGMPARMV